MISLIQPTRSRTTEGIKTIIGLIVEKKESLLSIIKVTKPDGDDSFDYAFSAVFKEENMLGQFVAFLNLWGTNSGPRSGGTGRWGYCQVMSLIEDLNLKDRVDEIRWDKIDIDLRARMDSKNELERNTAWKEFVTFRVDLTDIKHLYPRLDYKINDKWMKKYQVKE